MLLVWTHAHAQTPQKQHISKDFLGDFCLETLACRRSVLAVSSMGRLLGFRIFRINIFLRTVWFSKNIYLFLGKVENVHLVVPVHWKDFTLAKELEGFSYPSMALQSYSTSPSTCWRGTWTWTWTSKPPTAHLKVDSLKALSLALLEEKK